MMQRFLLTFCLVATFMDATRVLAQETLPRPNVLFVFADDWGRYASIYGKREPGTINDVVKTPHFDALAEKGVLFTRAFVNAPSCTPCRSSLLSGQYFWRTGRGAILQGAVWDSSIPTFPLLLEKSGYAIGHTGKVWSPGTPANAPIGAQRTGHNKAGRQFNDFSEALDKATDEAATREKLLTEVRGNFEGFLKQRPGDKPFCYWWGPTNTHRTWIKGSGKRFWNIDPESLKGRMPKHLPDVTEVREDVADYLGEVQALDAGLGELLRVLEETGEASRTLVIVSGDHGMPGVPGGKCNLYDLGTRVSLAICCPDRIPGGRIVDDFVCLPDLAPTILEAAGVDVPKVMTGKSLLNVLKSDRSGTVDETRDFVVTGRERHVAAARLELRPYPQRAIRTADFLYIRNFAPDRWPMGTAPGYGTIGMMPDAESLETTTFGAFADMDASPTKSWLITHVNDNSENQIWFDRAFAQRPAEELFDLRADPDQIRNVAQDSKYAEVRKQLSERLMGILKETNDPRVTTDPPAFEQSPFTDKPN